MQTNAENILFMWIFPASLYKLQKGWGGVN